MSTHNTSLYKELEKIILELSLTHGRLNEFTCTIYWKSLISVLGMSGYVI